jgi:hypothetical protein
MARRVFHSFHFARDAYRVQQVRQMGVIEGQRLLSSNDWEAVKKRGKTAIEEWIAEQMKGKSCVVVLAGKETANREWVTYEISKAWNDGKGVVAVYIHNLKNSLGNQDTKGANPLYYVTFKGTSPPKRLSTIAKAYDPPFSTSTSVYNHIRSNLEAWVEEAIEIRNAN